LIVLWAAYGMAQIWADHQLEPWKIETFKVSNGPRFDKTR
jgi:hypothetical protein